MLLYAESRFSNLFLIPAPALFETLTKKKHFVNENNNHIAVMDIALMYIELKGIPEVGISRKYINSRQKPVS